MILVWTLIIIILITIFWFREAIIDSQRDISKVALSQQANTTVVRKSNETALYRNFMIPLQFPLNTGLSLSLGYKIRNGNFGDIWNAIMDINRNDKMSITFDDREFSMNEIHGMSMHFVKHLDKLCGDINNIRKNNSEPIILGINVPITSLSGFVISIACLIKTIKSGKEDKSKMVIPQLIQTLPRAVTKNNIDILVINSQDVLNMLGESKEWYSKIIICDEKMKPTSKDPSLLYWHSMMMDYSSLDTFEYVPPSDNSDELKPFMNITTKNGKYTTCFNQLNVVSSVSTFIKSFPINHELSSNDVLTILTESNDLEFQFQMWPKVLSVLLHGGSIVMNNISMGISNTELSDSKMKNTRQNTSLLFTTPKLFSVLCKDNKYVTHLSPMGTIKFKFAKLLLNSGIMTHSFGSNTSKLRCIFLHYYTKRYQEISEFDSSGKPPAYKKGQLSDTLTVESINKFRLLFNSRIIPELYSDNLILGPIAQTNFYDYRTLPESTEKQVTCFGPVSMSLEGKLIETKSNPNFDIKKRQGMLCLRGFTIGKPLEPERIQSATQLSEKMARGEGWMPLVGVYGLWGQDGCLYLFK